MTNMINTSSLTTATLTMNYGKCDTAEKNMSKQEIIDIIEKNAIEMVETDKNKSIIAYLKTKEELTTGSIIIDEDILLNLAKKPEDMIFTWEHNPCDYVVINHSNSNLCYCSVGTIESQINNIQKYKEIIKVFDKDYHYYQVSININDIETIDETSVKAQRIKIEKEIKANNLIDFEIVDIFTIRDEKGFICYNVSVKLKSKLSNYTTPEFLLKNIYTISEANVTNEIKKEIENMKSLINIKEHVKGSISATEINYDIDDIVTAEEQNLKNVIKDVVKGE